MRSVMFWSGKAGEVSLGLVSLIEARQAWLVESW